MSIGHIILIRSNPLGVKSSWRIDASLMLCETCAFYLVTRQPRCLISIAEPAGNVLLRHFVGDIGKTFEMFWLWTTLLHLKFDKCVHLSWSQFQQVSCSCCVFFLSWPNFHPVFQIKTTSEVFVFFHKQQVLNWIFFCLSFYPSPQQRL